MYNENKKDVNPIYDEYLRILYIYCLNP